MEVSESDSSSIIKWYQKQTVLVTGGSGFLGKALLFKLLQIGCPRTFVIIRPKKDQNPEKRLDTILQHEIFDRIRENDPEYRSKVIAIPGELTSPNLGMSDKDRELICETVTVVFHGAASVRFDDSLKTAVHTNLKSTRDMVELAMQIKHIKIFNYISTSYSNSEHMMDENGIEEKVYEKKMSWEKLIEFVDNTPEELINAVEQKIVGASCNTYMFTKNLSESLIDDYSDRVPLVITRPPVVNPSYKEPYPGWLDNISSPAAIVGGCGKGVLRVYYGTPHAKKSYLPVDFCTNCNLVAAWHEALKYQNDVKQPLSVYNQDSCPLTTSEMKGYCFQMLDVQPVHGALWHTYFHTVNDRHLFLIGFLLLHFLPGLIIDVFLKIAGQKMRMLRIYRKLHATLMALLPVLNLDDKFDITNYNKLKSFIPQHEKEVFYLDVPKDPSIFYPYMVDCSYGFRKLLGDPPYPTQEDFAHQKRLKWIDRIFRYTFIFLFLWVFPYRLFFAPFLYVYNSVTEFTNSV